MTGCCPLNSENPSTEEGTGMCNASVARSDKEGAEVL